MRLNLREIIEMPGASLPFETELETDNLDFASVKEYVSKPRAFGSIYNEAGIVHMEGEVEAEMVCICDRCGTDFTSTKITDLDVVIVEKTEDNQDDPELFFLEGDDVDLDEVVSTCFILDMESKFLCKEDCKGLCTKCGRNLNLGPCGCGKEIDPRFAVLEQLLDK